MTRATAPHDPENPYAGQGAVLLDIGDGVGALVVLMPREMVGREVEIRVPGALPTGAHHPHVAVVERPTPTVPVPSLVFSEVREGTYELAEKGIGTTAVAATVRAGAVTELSWPT